MKINKLNKKAFTLVELLVVVVIISLLSGLWFFKLSWYLEWVRDTKRVSQIKDIWQALEIFVTTKELPLPEAKIDIINGSWTLAYQWDIWKNIFNLINYKWDWSDPKTKEYYTYEVSKDRKNFQLMINLEKQSSFVYNFSMNTVNANENIKYFPYLYWDKLWILTWVDLNKTPIHRLSEINTVWNINIDTVVNNYIAYVERDVTIEWNKDKLNIISKIISVWWRLFTNCDEILLDNSNYRWRPWYYAIIPDWYTVVETYCNF